jgi:hypothetical protein
MDREAVVIREEMSQTRAELDRKITLLEARAHELGPRTVAERYLPEYAVDRALGAVLTLVGLGLAWSTYRRRERRARIRTVMATYGHW